MTGYQCRVERDSINQNGYRLTSFVIRFPRIVLAEAVTHRMVSDSWGDADVSLCERNTTSDISKNSASSRAIPFAKMVETIKDDPYMPQWTLNQKGMQGDAADAEVCKLANIIWQVARDNAVHSAARLCQLGIHKQDCNRLLEPFAWITQIVTATEWDNYFALRCHHAAHPALRHIARMMFLARRQSVPDQLVHGQWHLPFVPRDEALAFRWLPRTYEPLPPLIRHSAARCAWISYENHDRDGTPEQMERTFDRLVAETPKHASPVEHQATPTNVIGGTEELFNWRSNLRGWVQARKLVPLERIDKYEPSDEEIASWGLGE